METFYIFSSQTGDFIGTRGIAPEPESDEIGILQTPETLAQLTACLVPKLYDGQIVESATPEQIAEAQNPMTTPISRMRFWLNVWRVLRLTEDNIVDQINQLPDSNEKIELLIKVKSASEFDRYDPSLIHLAGQMNIPDEVLNQIFT
jgi:hypothetical protein